MKSMETDDAMETNAAGQTAVDRQTDDAKQMAPSADPPPVGGASILEMLCVFN